MTSPLSSLPVRADLLPSLAVAMSGAVWGLFWIPMRELDAVGVRGAWAAAVFFGLTLVLVLPLLPSRLRSIRSGGPSVLLTGILTGSAFAFYAVSLVHTTVVNSILLFYLTPVWSTVLGRLLLGEPITRTRGFAVATGLTGLWVILGVDSGLPLPRNAGDWLALVSGACWAYGSLRIYDDTGVHHVDAALVFIVAGTVASVATLALPLPGHAEMPALDGLMGRAGWVLIIAVLAITPTNFLIIWAATRLGPVRVGLLLMLEVVVGIGSAAILIEEPFGVRQVVGGVLIVSAGVLEMQREAAPRHRGDDPGDDAVAPVPGPGPDPDRNKE